MVESLQTSPWIVPDQRGLRVIDQIRPWAVSRGFRAGSTLFDQGAKVPGLFFILEGTVKQIHLSPDGQERLFMILSAGCQVGEISVLDGMPSQLAAVAMTNVKTLFLERTRVLELLQSEGEFALYLTLSMTRQLRASVKQLADSTSRPIPERLGCLLHHLTRQMGPDKAGSPVVTLQVSQQQLAEMLGVSRVTVATCIADLRAKGILETGHRVLTIRSPESLRTCGNSPYCITRGKT